MSHPKIYPKRPKLTLNYTEREWDDIERSIRETLSESENRKKKDVVIGYIIKEAKKLEGSFLNFHPIPKEKLEPASRQYYPPEYIYEIIYKLAEKINIHPNEIAAKFILNPLLKK